MRIGYHRRRLADFAGGHAPLARADQTRTLAQREAAAPPAGAPRRAREARNAALAVLPGAAIGRGRERPGRARSACRCWTRPG